MTVSRNVTDGLVTTVVVQFSSLHTSHSGIYTCISNIDDPPSREQAVHLLQIKSKNLYYFILRLFTYISNQGVFYVYISLPVPHPRLLITREPAHPVRLFTTNSLILTCIIQLVPEVDIPVTINSQWTGHSSLTDNRGRVSVSKLKGLHPLYESTVIFSTLKISDSGSYVCSANVSPQTGFSGSIVESTWSSETLYVSVCK